MEALRPVSVTSPALKTSSWRVSPFEPRCDTQARELRALPAAREARKKTLVSPMALGARRDPIATRFGRQVERDRHLASNRKVAVNIGPYLTRLNCQHVVVNPYAHCQPLIRAEVGVPRATLEFDSKPTSDGTVTTRYPSALKESMECIRDCCLRLLQVLR